MTKTLLLDPIWGPNFFVHRFYLYQQVGIIPSYHPMLFSGKLMNKLEKMAKKKTGFRPDFGSFGSNLGPKNFFDVRHCCKLSLYAISRKTNEPSLRKQQKNQFCGDFGLYQPKFGPQKYFVQVLPLLDVKHYCKLSLYTILRRTNKPNLRKQQKKTQFQA